MKVDISRLENVLRSSSDVREEVDHILFCDTLNSLLDSLPERMAFCIRKRYWDEMTYRDIGKLKGISCERVRQIIMKGLRMLQHPKRSNELRKLEIPCLIEYEPSFDAYVKKKIESENKQKIDREHEEIERWKKHCFDRQTQMALNFEYYRRLNEDKRKLKEAEEAWFEEQKKDSFVIYVPMPIVKPIIKRPNFVTLINVAGQPRLACDPRYGTISRDRDPETYDRWLNELIEKDLA